MWFVNIIAIKTAVSNNTTETVSNNTTETVLELFNHELVQPSTIWRQTIRTTTSGIDRIAVGQTKVIHKLIEKTSVEKFGYCFDPEKIS